MFDFAVLIDKIVTEYLVQITHISVTNTIVVFTVFIIFFVKFHNLRAIEISKFDCSIFGAQPLAELDIIMNALK